LTIGLLAAPVEIAWATVAWSSPARSANASASASAARWIEPSMLLMSL
jgi:hypothetical protein